MVGEGSGALRIGVAQSCFWRSCVSQSLRGVDCCLHDGHHIWDTQLLQKQLCATPIRSTPDPSPTMHNTLNRIQGAFGFFTTVAFVLAAFIAATDIWSPRTPSGTINPENVQV